MAGTGDQGGHGGCVLGLPALGLSTSEVNPGAEDGEGAIQPSAVGSAAPEAPHSRARVVKGVKDVIEVKRRRDQHGTNRRDHEPRYTSLAELIHSRRRPMPIGVFYGHEVLALLLESPLAVDALTELIPHVALMHWRIQKCKRWGRKQNQISVIASESIQQDLPSCRIA